MSDNANEAMRIAMMLAEITAPTYTREQLNQMGYDANVPVFALNNALKTKFARDLFRKTDPEFGAMGKSFAQGFKRDESGSQTKIVIVPQALIYAGNNMTAKDGSPLGKFEIHYRATPNPEKQKDGIESVRTDFLNKGDAQVVYQDVIKAAGKIATLAIEYDTFSQGGATLKNRILRDVMNVRQVRPDDLQRLQIDQNFIQQYNIQVAQPRN